MVIGRGRALFRFADLMELASLVTRLCSERRSEPLTLCKENFAANVKQMTPQEAPMMAIYAPKYAAVVR